MEIKQYYQNKLKESIDLNDNISKIKRDLKTFSNDIITDINNSKIFNGQDIVNLITYSLIWQDELIKEIEQSKEKIKQREKEELKKIEEKANKTVTYYIIGILILLFITFINI